MYGRRARIAACAVLLAVGVGACSSPRTSATPTSTDSNRGTAGIGEVTTEAAPTSTTIVPIVPSTTLPVPVANLDGCPRQPADLRSAAHAATLPLTRELVPMAALNVRSCRYDRSGSSWQVQNVAWVALSVATDFERQTNALSPSLPPMDCPKADASTWYLLTFARDTKTVDVLAGGCPITVSNGAITTNASPEWYRAVTQLGIA